LYDQGPDSIAGLRGLSLHDCK